MKTEKINLVEHQQEVKSEYDIKEKESLDLPEQDKVFVYQKNDKADGGHYVFNEKRNLRELIEEFYHQRIQFFSAVMDDFQREIGIAHAQEKDRQDQCQVFCIVPVHIIVPVFLFPTGMPSMAFEYVFAEGAGGQPPPVGLFSSFRLHKSPYSMKFLFSPILFKRKKESIILRDDIGG
jgi:hypothetical protein